MDYNELFDRVSVDGSGRKHSLADLVKAMGWRTDLDRLRASGAAAAMARMMENQTMNPDEHSPASVAYWAKLGMVKEFHGEDNPMDWDEFAERTGFCYDVENAFPQNLFKKWTSFVPMSAFREENKGRKYPAVVVLHGGGNSVYTIDGWGFPKTAAEHEWILIVPSVEMDSVVLEILEEAKTLYPIDTERMYLCGFSYGSINTNIIAHQHPEVFAAVGPCGGFLSNGVFAKAFHVLREQLQGGEANAAQVPADPRRQIEPDFPFEGPYRSLERGVKLPVITVSGDCDGDKYPIYASVSADEMIRDINLWARINDAPELSPGEVSAVADSAGTTREDKTIGYPFGAGCSRSVEDEGTVFDVGDIPSRDGVSRIRIICEENTPHWPAPGLSRRLFEFFSHFSRDAVTGESVYHA